MRPKATLEAMTICCEAKSLSLQQKSPPRELGKSAASLADIPSVVFEIARRLGVPSIGVANFCWHWIYEPYVRRFPGLARIVEHIRHQESLATLLLRLPFAWDFDCFPDRRDVPLIGRRATYSRGEARRRLGIESNRRVALLSFGGYGLDERVSSASTAGLIGCFLQPSQRKDPHAPRTCKMSTIRALITSTCWPPRTPSSPSQASAL